VLRVQRLIMANSVPDGININYEGIAEKLSAVSVLE
jgi:hypothetical protein